MTKPPRARRSKPKTRRSKLKLKNYVFSERANKSLTNLKERHEIPSEVATLERGVIFLDDPKAYGNKFGIHVPRE